MVFITADLSVAFGYNLPTNLRLVRKLRNFTSILVGNAAREIQ